MGNKTQDLAYVLNLEKFQALQDALAAVTDMAIITINYKGEPVTKHSRCSEFCRTVRDIPFLSEQCQKCDSRGGIEAVRLQKPYIYLCHFGILDAAIPIMVNNRYLGAIMIGQVILTNDSNADNLEVLCRLEKDSFDKHMREHGYLLNKIPRMSFKRVETIVDMLFHLGNHIVDGAIEKDFTLYPVNELRYIKRKLDNVITSSYVSTNVNNEIKDVNKTLRPAMEYINEHKNERCLMSHMAALCHISPSYFSKLFLKEMGMHYSSYLVNVRLVRATELLTTTDISIQEIAFSVGFSDAGHFIRSFKAKEGMTPARYRKLIQ